jgi:hypothetical protein
LHVDGAAGTGGIGAAHVYSIVQGASVFSLAVDGGAPVTASSSSLPSGTTTFNIIGDSGNGARTTIYYAVAFFLQALTTAQNVGWNNAVAAICGTY